MRARKAGGDGVAPANHHAQRACPNTLEVTIVVKKLSGAVARVKRVTMLLLRVSFEAAAETFFMLLVKKDGEGQGRCQPVAVAWNKRTYSHHLHSKALHQPAVSPYQPGIWVVLLWLTPSLV